MNLIDTSNYHETQTEAGLLSCEVCLKEIPISEASSSETADYIIYFFGIECFGLWSKNR